jgi:hypothetical protein
MEYKCEIVTPAGRKKYLELLYKNLKLQKNSFDIWQLWLNTTNDEDIEYMRNLEKENDWIVCIESKVPVKGRDSIYHFFENTKREDTIYIFFDDDIIYLSENFISEFKELRIKNTKSFFVLPNIINNGLLSYIHYRNNLVKFPVAPKYYFLDNVGWKDPYFCEALHKAFLNDLTNNNIQKWKSSFGEWKLYDYERMSFDCFAFFGSNMKHEIRKIDNPDFENQISSIITKKYDNPAVVYGNPICVHYSFSPQRKHLETTDVFGKYSEMINQKLSI